MFKFLKIKIIFVVLLIITITLNGCVDTSQKINKLDLKKYNVDSELIISKITCDELIKYDENDSIDGLVLVIKESCNYCQPFMEKINNIFETGKELKKLYAIESDEMTLEQKTYVYDKYILTSVPTIMVFEKGEFKGIEVGNIEKDNLEKIITK